MTDEQFFETLAKEKLNAEEGFSAGGPLRPRIEASETSPFRGGEVRLAKASSVEPQAAEPKVPSAAEKSKLSKKNRDDEPEGQLAIDVYQTPSDIVVESAIAGVKPEDIDINVTSDSVTIKGQRSRDEEIKGDDYYYQECYWGRFSRSVILPQEIDPERAEVTFRGGILSVRLPKANKKKQRKLKVKTE